MEASLRLSRRIAVTGIRWPWDGHGSLRHPGYPKRVIGSFFYVIEMSISRKLRLKGMIWGYTKTTPILGKPHETSK